MSTPRPGPTGLARLSSKPASESINSVGQLASNRQCALIQAACTVLDESGDAELPSRESKTLSDEAEVPHHDGIMVQSLGPSILHSSVQSLLLTLRTLHPGTRCSPGQHACIKCISTAKGAAGVRPAFSSLATELQVRT